MHLTLIPRPALSESQQRHLEARLRAPEHRGDKGPPTVWHSTYRENGFLVFSIPQEAGAPNLPIGIVHESGRPLAAVGWWIDFQFRGQGYGSQMACLLGPYLKCQGVKGLSPNHRIDTFNDLYDKASSCLTKKLREFFAENCNA